MAKAVPKGERRNSAQTEMQLAGCLLLSGTKVWPKVRQVRDEAFFWPANRELWAWCRAQCERGRDPDLVQLGEAGLDLQYAIECAESVEHVSKSVQYAEVVMELWALRAYRDFAAELARLCDDVETDPSDVHRKVSDEVKRIESGRPPSVKAPSLSDVIANLSDKAEPGIPTGFEQFDSSNVHGGLAKGEPTYIGAATGVGKTVLGVQIAAYAAASAKRVLFVTLELDAKAISRRFLSVTSGHRTIYDAQRCGEGEAYLSASKEIEFWDLDVYDPAILGPGSDSVEAFVSYAERTHDRIPWDLIVLDYAQLLGTRRSWHSDVARHESTAAEIRMLAKRTGVAMAVLAQAQRDPVDRKGRLRLRNSREFENGANAIILLDQIVEDKTTRTFLVCDKNRDGRRFKQEVMLQMPWGRFVPVPKDVQDGVYRGGE